ncbi:MAG: hypothetical protein LM580_12750 [Thermofilum sp.]|nr:hypothetical protein [Thermofilum sp.]
MPRRSVPVTLEDVLTKAPLWEIQRQLAKYIAWSAFLARNAARIGAWIASSVELSWFDNAVQATITFRLQRTEVDERKTRAIMLTRLQVARRLLGHVLKMLEDEGIKVVVDERTAVSSSQVPEMVSATFVLRLLDVDAAKFLGKATKKWRIVYESRSTVGGVHVSTLKAEETSALIEYERRSETLPPEEDMGVAAEGGGEEELGAAGLDLISPREAAEGGYLRLSEATLRYGVPMGVLMRLVLDGRIEYRYGVDEKGAPALYVKEEAVKEVARYFKPEIGKEGEGGSGGG